MVDENDTNNVIENAEADAPVASIETKKKRAPRRSPAELAVVAAAKAAKSGGRKKAAQAEEAKVSVAAKSSKPSATTAKKPSAGAKTVDAGASSPAPVDEFADLAALEEENKSLRKALSEKLRTENADLRKRLGQ